MFVTSLTYRAQVRVAMVLSVVFVALAPCAVAVDVAIPDPLLEAALRAALGDPPGPLQDTDLATLTSLNADGAGIYDLTGLEACTSLATLSLNSNRIASVGPLGSLPALATVSLNNNRFCDVSPLSDNLGLASGDIVSVAGNPLSTRSCFTFISDLQSRGVTVNTGTACAGPFPITGCPLPANIPDPGLDAALRSALGIPNGPLYPDELASLTGQFNAAGYGIADLTGIEHCTGLTILDVSDNTLGSLAPLASLTGLKELNLSDNNTLSNLSPLASLTQLETLDASGNLISDLSPLAGLTSLTRLELGSNQIADLSPLDGLTNLETLNLPSNEIVNLAPLAGLTNLTRLDLENNQIVDLSRLSNLSALETLSLPNNLLTGLSTLPTLPALRSLRLSNNPITSLAGLDPQPALDFLSARGCEFSDLSPLAEIPSLRDISISDNPISDLSPLAEIVDLADLTVADAQVSDLGPLATLSALLYLEIGGNQVEDLSPLAGLLALEEIYFDDNQVVDLSPLANLPALNTAYFNRNSICDLSPLLLNTGLGAGDDIEAAGNPLTVAGCDSVADLEALGVSVDVGTACDGGGLLSCPSAEGEGEGAIEGEGVVEGVVEGEGEGVVEGGGEGVVEGEGEIDYAVCPGDSLQSQPPDRVSEFIEFRFSDANRNRIVYENFTDLAGAISGITWWGFGLDTSNPEVGCVRDPNTFQIAFYTDGGGAPLTLVDNREVTPVGEPAFVIDGGPTVLRYTVAFDTPISLSTGWVKIQGINNPPCDWAWYPSLEGDELSVEEIVGVSQTIVTFNPAICVTGDVAEGEGEGVVEGEGEGVLEGEGEGEGADEIVVIPDPNLEAVIRTKLGIPSDPLRASDLATIRDLNGFNTGIIDLTGIEYCTDLRTLNLNNNSIVNFAPLSGLLTLTSLEIVSNPISDLAPISGLVNLTRLQFAAAPLDDLSPLSSLTKLQNLFATNCQFADLSPLSSLLQLKFLNLYDNVIVDVGPLSTLTNLESLDLSQNDICDLAALVNNAGLGAGDYLDVSRNPLGTEACTTQVPELSSRVTTFFANNTCSGGGTGECVTEGEGAVEGEGSADGEGAVDGEGLTEGTPEGEGAVDGEGVVDGEGTADGEGSSDGEGGDDTTYEQLLQSFVAAESSGNNTLTLAEIQSVLPGFTQQELDDTDYNGDGELSVAELLQSVGGGILSHADTNGDSIVQLTELLRLIQLYNAGLYACAENAGATEDGFALTAPPSEPACVLHSVDQNGDKEISLSELLRGIQLYNLGGYTWCPGQGTEDGFCG